MNSAHDHLRGEPVRYLLVNGHKFAPGFAVDNVKSALGYTARPDDLFVVTYPKCGTTWMQHIVLLLLNDGQWPADVVEGGYKVRSPFLEEVGAKVAEDIVRPNAIKTHLVYDLQPFHEEAKYIYVARNPKDVCVSFYYHSKAIPSYAFDGDFHQYFKCWMEGEVECGHYYEHVLSWWDHRHDDNVLFLIYEDMKTNPREAVLQVAAFILGNDFKKLLNENKHILDDVLTKSGFDSMKDVVLAKNQTLLRKGEIGDWTNHMTEQESQQLEDLYLSKFNGTGLEYAWRDYNVFSKLT